MSPKSPEHGINRRHFLGCAAVTALFPAVWLRGQDKHTKALSPLILEKGRLVDETGREVLLRGINAGSWFLVEPWICGISVPLKSYLRLLARQCEVEDGLSQALSRLGSFDDDTILLPEYLERLTGMVEQIGSGSAPGKFRERLRLEPPVLDAMSLDRLLRTRFGHAGADTFWETFHSCWITAEDLSAARAAGFNFIRLPFWYRWLESDDTPGVIRDSGLQMLASAVARAREAGLYVLLNLHGAPGGQSMWDHTGEMGQNRFFRSPALQERTASLWQAVARYFRHEPAVVGYDLLNEPAGAEDLAEWTQAHDRLYQGIRTVDADRLIIMEDGYKTEEPRYALRGWFPRPEDTGWQRIMYSLHFYKTGPFSAHERHVRLMMRLAQRESSRCGVPLYIGEFNPIEDTPDGLRAMVCYGRAFSEAGIHWSPWTLKYCGEDADRTLWGLRRCRERWETLDPYRDDLEILLAKIRRYADSRYFCTHERYASAMKPVLAESG